MTDTNFTDSFFTTSLLHYLQYEQMWM